MTHAFMFPPRPRCNDRDRTRKTAHDVWMISPYHGSRNLDTGPSCAFEFPQRICQVTTKIHAFKAFRPVLRGVRPPFLFFFLLPVLSLIFKSAFQFSSTNDGRGLCTCRTNPLPWMIAPRQATPCVPRTTWYNFTRELPPIMAMMARTPPHDTYLAVYSLTGFWHKTTSFRVRRSKSFRTEERPSKQPGTNKSKHTSSAVYNMSIRAQHKRKHRRN